MNDDEAVMEVRVVSLLPSATEIVGRLGIGDKLIAISHECDVCDGVDRAVFESLPRVTTTDIDIHALSQTSIDSRVKSTIGSSKSLYSINQATIENAIFNNNNDSHDKPESATAWNKVVVITQSLCDVCAPAENDVKSTCARIFARNKEKNSDSIDIQVLSVQPSDCQQIADSVSAIGNACGVDAREINRVRNEMLMGLESLKKLMLKRTENVRVAVVEWLEPVFCGGHWVPEMVEYAGCVNVLGEKTQKSKEIEWSDVKNADPDVIIVACCGFDLSRNLSDARRVFGVGRGEETTAPMMMMLKAVQNKRVYAVDGNKFFARPAPSVAAGAAVIARVAFDHTGEAQLLNEIEALDCYPRGDRCWQNIFFEQHANNVSYFGDGVGDDGGGDCGDVEDVWMRMHEEACGRGEKFYVDERSGFRVFTRVAHEERGKCCGSGCRHCPFAHENVHPARKARVIQQPAVVYQRKRTRSVRTALEQEEKEQGEQEECGAAQASNDPSMTVLFWSGGKDSFLALRAIARAERAKLFKKEKETRGVCFKENEEEHEDGLERVCLLTTFDARTRVVAHQELPFDVIVRQAEFLDVTLIGVPLHSGAVRYEQRIAAALSLIQNELKITNLTLAFGDLHLEHIIQWRKHVFGKPMKDLSNRNHESGEIHVRLEFPLVGVEYGELLEELERSTVPCVVSARGGGESGGGGCADGIVDVGMRFDRSVARELQEVGADGFGENGEFHTQAQVWLAQSRNTAIGLENADRSSTAIP
mmetsp:Transcript_16631/g.36163  ORF Transcript_16631/g.36163 Transcript_16631/m.36163 type:complete len:760 (+) Transcript_16631:55-2334(+)